MLCVKNLGKLNINFYFYLYYRIFGTGTLGTCVGGFHQHCLGENGLSELGQSVQRDNCSVGWQNFTVETEKD